jgi:hypothetical protein
MDEAVVEHISTIGIDGFAVDCDEKNKKCHCPAAYNFKNET